MCLNSFSLHQAGLSVWIYWNNQVKKNCSIENLQFWVKSFYCYLGEMWKFTI